MALICSGLITYGLSGFFTVFQPCAAVWCYRNDGSLVSCLTKKHPSFHLSPTLSFPIASALQFASRLSQTAFVISLSSLCACVFESTENILLKLTVKPKGAKIGNDQCRCGDHSCVIPTRTLWEEHYSCWLFKTLLCECLFLYSLCLLL